MICAVRFNYYDFYHTGYHEQRAKLHAALTEQGVCGADFLLHYPTKTPFSEQGEAEKTLVKEWDNLIQDFLKEYFILDLERLMKYSGIKFSVDAKDDNVDKLLQTQILKVMFNLQEKLKTLEVASPVEQIINVTIGDGPTSDELIKINKIEVMENYCTDELQRALTEGWRILAVCPQKNQRRPDYVLGRVEV